MLTPTGFLTEPRQVPNSVYEKPLFERKLSELKLRCEFTRRVMSRLGRSFSVDDLRAALQAEQFRLPDGMGPAEQNAAQGIWMLARSNYEVQFQPEQQLCERILFPAHPLNVTALRMRDSFTFRTTTAHPFTTPLSPLSMAGL